jgi:hypothetical protein
MADAPVDAPKPAPADMTDFVISPMNAAASKKGGGKGGGKGGSGFCNAEWMPDPHGIALLARVHLATLSELTEEVIHLTIRATYKAMDKLCVGGSFPPGNKIRAKKTLWAFLQYMTSMQRAAELSNKTARAHAIEKRISQIGAVLVLALDLESGFVQRAANKTKAVRTDTRQGVTPGTAPDVAPEAGYAEHKDGEDAEAVAAEGRDCAPQAAASEHSAAAPQAAATAGGAGAAGAGSAQDEGRMELATLAAYVV